MAESSTLMTIFLHALKRLPLQAIFDGDPYESRRTALKGEKLMWVLVAFQLLIAVFNWVQPDNHNAETTPECLAR